MIIITGTALSKNTPVKVLQELAYQERVREGQDELSDLAEPTNEQESSTAEAEAVFSGSE